MKKSRSHPPPSAPPVRRRWPILAVLAICLALSAVAAGFWFTRDPEGMVWIPPGEFWMGSDDFPDAHPVHRVYVNGFWMDRTEVTNEQFAAFVAATGYQTIAESQPDLKDFPGVDPKTLVPFSGVFVPPAVCPPEDCRECNLGWQPTPGACWKHPEGPGSTRDGREKHPVVHIAFALPAPAAEPDHGLHLPPGFEVTQFADDRLAPDIHCLTLDPKGRVIVSGRGYVRLLVDDDGDGKADRALDFADAPKDGAMGLFWERDSLYCVGDGGLRLYRDANGPGRLRPSQILFKCKTGGEHQAHAIRRGPDGWLYFLCGDHTGIDRTHATLPTSPIKDPLSGCVLRFPPDFSGCEIIADGYRNAYGMDFGSDGELFTFDSDNERCVSLPWYEPTRCYHVQIGGHHGWRGPKLSATWRYPPYFLDVVAPICTLGRGSPTGVVCYKHTQFPPRYRGGLFLLDWTFGVIHFVTLQRHGSTYIGKPEFFLRATGDNGFAPTAAAVHPLTGDLYISIGGRGTRGAVYRIRYTAGLPTVKPADVARLQPSPRSLDWHAGLAEPLLRDAAGTDLHARRRALELIIRHHERFTAAQIETAIRASAGHDDRGLRQTAARLLAALNEKEQNRIGKLLATPLERMTFLLARPGFEAADLVKDRRLPPAVRLDGVRLLQIALGGLTATSAKGTVFEGYTRRKEKTQGANAPRSPSSVLRDAFPAGHPDLDSELARTLAMLADDSPDTLQKVSAFLRPETNPIDEVHYLIALARLTAPRTAEVTRKTAYALLDLDRKLRQRKLNRDTNWPLRIAELHAALAERDPTLNRALVEHPLFGRPDHALFTRAKGFDRVRAANVFLTRAAADASFTWNAELVSLVGELPAEKSLPVLHKLWGEHGLDEAILPVLARKPRAEDHAKFLTGLTSARLSTVASALSALEKLRNSPADSEHHREEAFALLRAIRQTGSGKAEEKLRSRLLARLGAITAQKRTTIEQWDAYFRKRWPELSARLNDADGVDVAGWRKRLDKIDWPRGDATKGQAVFVKASCASCHSGTAALGPDLRGVAGRFSRADLFTAILQPSKDVAPRYRTTQMTTAAGKIYQGIIAYEAVDSVLLLTGPGQSVRIAHKQISERRLTAMSLMPAGLLDRLGDGEIANLYAYLKSLTVAGSDKATR
jgi:putative heme-binding domain-containing protein